MLLWLHWGVTDFEQLQPEVSPLVENPGGHLRS